MDSLHVGRSRDRPAVGHAFGRPAIRPPPSTEELSMNSTKLAGIGLAAALVAVLPAVPAQAAGVARTFLSAAGSDSNNCANVLTPCRHLATAYAATAPDGEIYVLDPANYGSLTITHGVSIEGHGWASIAPVTGQAAITINAPGATDKINIIGVVLDGTNLASTTGIQFNSGGTLIVRDSVIRNFTQHGIYFSQSISSSLSQLYVSNTLISDNGGVGIFIQPASSGSTNAVLNHVEALHNASGGLFITTASQTMNVTVSDSVSSNNGSDGIDVESDNGKIVNVMVRNSTVANNVATGLKATGSGGSIRATRSTITGNGTAWSNSTGGGGTGQVTSYADNNIEDNGTANTAPTPVIYK
jgi:hypothetical protein